MAVEVLIPLAGIAMIVLIILIGTRARERATTQRAELIREMIGKFSSGEEFAKAMRGPNGEGLTEVLALEPRSQSRGWVGLFIPGAILGSLGLGFFLLAWIENQNFVIPGVIVSAVGVGLLASALVARGAQGEKAEDDEDETNIEGLGGD